MSSRVVSMVGVVLGSALLGCGGSSLPSSCDKLATCCPSLSTADQTACLEYVSAKVGAACTGALQSFETAGGCSAPGGDGGFTDAGDMARPVSTSKYATSSITYPTSSSRSAWDLDGDGAADNRFGSLVGVVDLTGNTQDSVNTSVMSGAYLSLISETSTDPTQQSATGATVTLSLAHPPTTAPKYDGTDTFTAAGSTATLTGDVASGTFTSQDPAHATTPVTTTIQLVIGGAPVSVPMTAARITFTRTSSGAITAGQLNGAIKKADVDAIVVPQLAAQLTTQLAADPSNTTLSMFDTNHDGTITAAEIQANATLHAFLSPDVQLFNASGGYQPNPSHTTPDCLSIGYAFTAVAATF